MKFLRNRFNSGPYSLVTLTVIGEKTHLDGVPGSPQDTSATAEEVAWVEPEHCIARFPHTHVNGEQRELGAHALAVSLGLFPICPPLAAPAATM